MGIIIILIIIMLIIKFNGAKIKGNVGEKRVANILSTLDNTKYKVINNLMIRTERGTRSCCYFYIWNFCDRNKKL